jgi:hypothetical protein
MAEDDKRESGETTPSGAPGAQPPGGAASPEREPAAWGNPLAKFDSGWTGIEAWLAVVVLALEIFALTLWVFLKGMSTAPESESPAGLVFRAIFGAVALGLIPFLALKSKGALAQRLGAIAGITVGILLARLWEGVGVDYSANLLNWYQQSSTLTLFGGLRGIGTRLTLMLALLGGSLATAKGKHITIDLVTRFVSERVRLPIVVISWFVAGVVSFAASWGFLDHIAIENFGAKAESTPGEKVSKVMHELGEHAFMLRKQIALDFKSTPHIVFRGEPYAEWMTAAEWNQWLDDSGFDERYGASYESAKIPEDQTRAPMIIIPGKGEPRGELVNAANLVFPFGLLMIALRFFLRSLLALSGHVSVDPEEEELAAEPAEGRA